MLRSCHIKIIVIMTFQHPSCNYNGDTEFSESSTKSDLAEKPENQTNIDYSHQLNTIVQCN